MRKPFAISALLVFVLCGCSRHEEERLAFDQLLSSNRIDRIVISGEKSDGSQTTNVLAGQQLLTFLAKCNATNRLRDAIHGRSEVTAKLLFFEGETVSGGLSYFSRERILSFQGYEFRLRDTNAIPQLLQ